MQAAENAAPKERTNASKSIGRSFNLKFTTLDKIIDDNNISSIDFLKMDIEGSEFQVLKHAKETGALDKVMCLVCELHINHASNRYYGEFMEYLTNFSYKTTLPVSPFGETRFLH